MTNLPIVGKFKVTAVFGQIGKYWKNGHQGIDIVSDDKNIYSTCDGTVRVVAYDANGWGQYVSIGDNNGRRHIFCHLAQNSVKVNVGDKVTRKTIIGTMGATGNVTGVHLHYQLQNGDAVIDPTGYLGIPNTIGSYNSKDYNIQEGVAKVFADNGQIASWAKNDVNKVSAAGIMLGDENNNFRPDDPVVRAEMATIICRGWHDSLMFNKIIAGSKPFKDVRATDWYYSYIEKCRKSGVLRGDENGCCNPLKDISRQDAIVMIMRMNYTDAQLSKVDVEALIKKSGFRPVDFNSVSDYAKPSMALALGSLIKGDENGAINPTKTISRQELAVVVARALDL